MANVDKLMDIVLGANPSEDDLRDLVRRIGERLPAPPVIAVTQAQVAEIFTPKPEAEPEPDIYEEIKRQVDETLQPPKSKKQK